MSSAFSSSARVLHRALYHNRCMVANARRRRPFAIALGGRAHAGSAQEGQILTGATRFETKWP
eukprot:12641481-Alexandrium_andersonii.AAC.1